LNITPAYSRNLPLPNQVHRFVSPDCSPRCVETEEPESGIDAPFDEPMVLFDEVVEIFTLSQLSATGNGSFFLQLLDLRRIGQVLIDTGSASKAIRQ
jgi:hypothetical protein